MRKYLLSECKSVDKGLKIAPKRLTRIQTLKPNEGSPLPPYLPSSPIFPSPSSPTPFLLEKPLEVVKPLPFQIAKDLHQKGFPKVSLFIAAAVG